MSDPRTPEFSQAPPPVPPPLPPAANAPPTVRSGVLPPPPPSTWPMALGIVVIVLGGLALLGAVWGVVSVLFMDAAFGMMPEEEESAAQLEIMRRYTPILAGTSAVRGVLAIVSIVGAIGLIARRAWSRPVLLTWAGLKCLVVVAETVAQYLMQTEMFSAIQQQQAAGGPPAAMMSSFLLIGVLFGVLWGWALPVFVTIWLCRGKIAVEVQGWRGAADPG